MKRTTLPVLLSSLAVAATVTSAPAHAGTADLNYEVVNRPPNPSEPYNPYVAEDLLVTLTSSDSYWTDALFRCDQLGVGINGHVYTIPSRGGPFEPPDPDAIFQDPLAFASLSAGTYNLWGKASGFTMSASSATEWYASTHEYRVNID